MFGGDGEETMRGGVRRPQVFISIGSYDQNYWWVRGGNFTDLQRYIAEMRF